MLPQGSLKALHFLHPLVKSQILIICSKEDLFGFNWITQDKSSLNSQILDPAAVATWAKGLNFPHPKDYADRGIYLQDWAGKIVE